MVQVADWEHPGLQTVIRTYDSRSDIGTDRSCGKQVAEEVLRCARELNEWNPSGSYCTTIPYNFREKRELTPKELLALVAGINAPDSRLPGSGARNSEGGDSTLGKQAFCPASACFVSVTTGIHLHQSKAELEDKVPRARSGAQVPGPGPALSPGAVDLIEIAQRHGAP